MLCFAAGFGAYVVFWCWFRKCPPTNFPAETCDPVEGRVARLLCGGKALRLKVSHLVKCNIN